MLLLLAAVTVPSLANTRLRSAWLTCVSNLREIGKGYRAWGADHGDSLPFLLRKEQGGIRRPFNGLEANSWFQFAWISNELSSARVLACPSDATARVANDFSAQPGGLLNSAQQNRSISYFLAYPLESRGHKVLSGDRNIGPFRSASCSIFSLATASGGYDPATAWDTNLHVGTGNLLFLDGSVAQTDSRQLRQALVVDTSVDNGDLHTLRPRP